jgi:hypothetical protein
MLTLTKNSIKNFIKSMDRGVIVFLAVILICSAGITAFLNFYIKAYQEPYMKREVYDLSEGWQYKTPHTDLTTLDTLRTGPYLQGGETMTLYRTLDIELPEAAVLIRANHQTVNVYLDDVPLFLDKTHAPEQNPGMALHFILLPDDYLNKTLKLEITSPYALYSGHTSPVLLGTIPSLEALGLSDSMRPFILMAMCLALGIAIIVFTFMQALGGAVRKGQFAIGVFAVIWALYYVCTEYIAFQFFTPKQMSVLSLGLYFSFQVPLSLFIYFSLEHYKKMMQPAAVLHSGFAAAAHALQLFSIVDLPRLININNILLTGLIYSIVLTVLEAVKKNRMMRLTVPFLIIAYISMLYNFNVFYARTGVVPYSYRDTFFLLILAVLIFSIWQFFKDVHRQQRENELLSLQKRLAQDSYDHIKAHLQEVAGLKHEIRSHFVAMQTCFEHGRIEEARSYLNKYTEQAIVVTEAVYHDNFLINAVLGGLLQKAGEHGITVDLNLKATPARIADPDFYSLLSNITSNALEACIAMPENKERFISLTVSRREPYLNTRCTNSKSHEIVSEDGKIQSTKAEEGHGYGLWTIKRIVDAYGGIMDIDYDENTFTIMAALKDK